MVGDDGLLGNVLGEGPKTYENHSVGWGWGGVTSFSNQHSSPTL